MIEDFKIESWSNEVVDKIVVFQIHNYIFQMASRNKRRLNILKRSSIVLQNALKKQKIDSNVACESDPIENEIFQAEISSISSKINLEASIILPSDPSDQSMNYPENSLNSISSNSSLKSTQSLRMNENLATDMREFIIETNQTNENGQKLLNILRKYNPVLPKSIKTFLGNEKHNSFQCYDVPPGKYIHFGLVKALTVAQEKFGLQEPIDLILNIDGLPLFNSTLDSFWPLLGALKNYKNSEFLIGLYFGKGKPHSAEEFLKYFIEEINSLDLNNVAINSENIKVNFLFCCCDLPAKSFVKGTKPHHSFYSCHNCNIKGETVENRRTFTKTDEERRSDNSFREKLQPEHHVKISPFENMTINMISFFPIDYMHCLCNGIGLKLLEKLRTGSKNTRLSESNIEEVTICMQNLHKNVPSDFPRKPRTLKHLGKWKATEIRLFCLYYGPYVFQKYIKQQEFRDLFMIYSTLFRILCHPTLSIQKNEYCYEMAETFLHNAQTLFGKEFITLNVHNIIHLVEDVSRLGCVDNFSCFRFENFMRFIKKAIRSPFRPLQQAANVVNRTGPFLGRFNSTEKAKQSILKQSYYPSDLPNKFKEKYLNFYKQYQVNNTVIKIKGADRYMLTDALDVVKVVYIAQNSSKNIHFIGHKLLNKQSSFEYPLDSSLIDIFKGLDWCRQYLSVPSSFVKCKLFKVFDDFFPIIHTYNMW